ncbi:MAG: hypothetical protein EB051_02525 [Chlamydiia bacterium]|nr:hypothetical protein [Chlamydiia bacterium]
MPVFKAIKHITHYMLCFLIQKVGSFLKKAPFYENQKCNFGFLPKKNAEALKNLCILKDK